MKFAVWEKTLIVNLWEKVAPEANPLGAEVLERLFGICPETKVYFSKFDLTPKSPDLLTHGGKFMNALGDGIKNLDNLKETMSSFTDLHLNKLHVTPDQFDAMSRVIQIVLGLYFPRDFTPKVNAVMNKYLDEVSSILFVLQSEKWTTDSLCLAALI
ncbi:hemoglobin heart muscle subunit alpha-type-like [Pelodytes ibericus]